MPAKPKHIIGLDGKIWLLKVQIAKETGLSAPTVSKRLEMMGLTPDDGGYYPVAPLIGDLTTTPEHESEFASERDRYFARQADKIELDLKERRLQSLPRSDVARAIFLVIKPMSELLDALPQILQRDADLDPKGIAKVEKALRHSRDSFVDQMELIMKGNLGTDADEDENLL